MTINHEGFQYCFRIEVAVVGAYLWEKCVLVMGNIKVKERKKTHFRINFNCSIMYASFLTALLFNTTFHAGNFLNVSFKLLFFFYL